jgi:hypothetical protein
VIIDRSKYDRCSRIQILTLGVFICSLAYGCREVATDSSNKSVPYVILYDEMNTIIQIGVMENVDETQLRQVLVNAADEHQDDAARDYLASMYLVVEALLTRQDGMQSKIPAGRLVRYVPPGNPAQRKKITTDRRIGDKFTMTLADAKRTLQ